MKKLISAIILSLVVILPIEAANLISITVADTLDEDIGDSVKIDLRNIRSEMQKVSKYTRLKLKEIIIQGSDTTPANLKKTLDKVSINKDDVVVFYFSGHGYHLESKAKTTPWPTLFFSQDGEGVEYEYVLHSLQKKNPRLLITLVDCCNNIMRNEEAPLLARALVERASISDTMKKNYIKLFLQTKGSIKIASSKVGEYSWGGSQGGLFTYYFLQKIKGAVLKNADWRSILKASSDETVKDSSESDSIQHPYYEIAIS